MSHGKIRICLKRTLNSTTFLTTTEQSQNKIAKGDSEVFGEGMDNEQQKKTHRERSKSHNDWSAQFSPPFASPTQPKSRPSSSNSPPSAAEEDENPLPAAFRIGNESESSDESGAERSEHEEEVIRRSKQIRNRERWELLKYKMLISSCCTPSKNPSKNDNELPANCKHETAEEEEQWDEEREREFVFSLL